jgi:hypothetical protein
MNKISKIILWIVFFFGSMYSLIQIDRWYVFTKVPVTLPNLHVFVDMWESGYVEVDGTISEKNGDYYDGLNVIKVTCDYQSRQCIHSVGGLFTSRSPSEFQPLLNLKTEKYRILNWDKDILIYKDTSLCSETIFTLVRNTKILSGVKKYSKKSSTCQREDEITYTIINGFEYGYKEKEKFQNVFLNILVSLLVFGISGYGIYRTIRPRKL